MNAKWICPAVTPFNPDGTVDTQSAGKLFDDLIAAGISGILIGGSIGEFFAQPIWQRETMARFAIKHINKRVPLIVGTASMIPDEIIRFSRTVLDAGADAVMIVPPYYFSFGDPEVYNFFAHMARNINGPIYLYNFPDRTGYSISPAVVRRLALEFPNIVGIKDTIAGMDHTREVLKEVKPERPDFEVFSGFDENFVHNVLAGGSGCIGGFSNIAPAFCGEWLRAVRADDLETVAKYQEKMGFCMDIYGIGSPFVPYVKEACRQMGHIAESKATFPLPDLDEAAQAKVSEFLKREGFL